MPSVYTELDCCNIELIHLSVIVAYCLKSIPATALVNIVAAVFTPSKANKL